MNRDMAVALIPPPLGQIVQSVSTAPPAPHPSPDHQLVKPAPLSDAAAEVEAPRGRNAARRHRGSWRWRSHEGHGSLGG